MTKRKRIQIHYNSPSGFGDNALASGMVTILEEDLGNWVREKTIDGQLLIITSVKEV